MQIKPFGPRMQSEIEGFSVVGELKWRAWAGIVADIWEVECSAGANGTYLSPDPRLFIPLSLEGRGCFVLRMEEGARTYAHELAYSMSYIPADQEVRGEALGLTRIKHLDLHMSEVSIRRRFGRALRRENLVEPRLGLEDERVATLARLIAATLEADQPCHDLYLDGLTNALLAVLFDVRTETRKRRPALSRAQLRVVMDHVDAHCLETIRLSDLARLVGLSDSYFSHAFKAAAGVAPHRWVMQVRIGKAQEMLARSDEPVSAVAAQCGFADQAHFNRVFRSVAGTTPASWKRDNRSDGA